MLESTIRRYPVFVGVVYGLLALLGSLMVFLAILARAVGSSIMPMAGVGLFFLVCLFVLFISLLSVYRDEPAIIFLIVGLPALLAFAFTILPNQVPDEIWHFYRTLYPFGAGGNGMAVPHSLELEELPKSFYDLAISLFAEPDWGNTVLIERELPEYLPQLYIIPAIPGAIGSFMGINPFALWYVCRIFNAAVFLAVGYAIIRMLPWGNTLACLYLLNPVMLQQQASVSADAFVNIATLLLLAFVFHKLAEPGFSTPERVLLGVLCVLASLSKYAYAPLALLVFLFLPRLKSDNLRIAIPVVVVVVIAAFILWMLYGYQGGFQTHSRALMRTPIRYIQVMANTFYQMGPWWIESFAGRYLGSYDIIPWAFTFWAYLIVLPMSALVQTDDVKHGLSFWQGVFVNVLGFLCVLLCIFSMVGWSIERHGVVDYVVGVQGRYLIPVLIIPLLCLALNSKWVSKTSPLRVYAITMVCIYAIDLLAVVQVNL